MPPDVTLILPAYNERGSIARTIAEAVDFFTRRGSAYEIVVAADGDDGTRELVSEMARQNPALRVLGENARRGKGRGIREAVAVAGGAIIGFADADNKVPIEEFDRLEPWFRQGFDAVIGSRARSNSRVERSQPFYRRLGGRGFHYFMQAVVGLPGISDTQCGFKFFRRDVAKELFRRQRIDGYMFDVEILSLALRLRYRVKEVPIRWRDDGDSRLALVRNNIRNVIDIFRIRFSRLEGD